MASSTSMPTTSDSASMVMVLIEKPNIFSAQNVGMMASGSATAEISVARTSRRKNQTTRMASSAPSASISIELWKLSRMYSACVYSSVILMLGYFFCSCCTASRVRSATCRAPSPQARCTSKPITGLPSSSATCLTSAAWSRTSAMESRRTLRPSCSGMRSAARSCTLEMVPSVRTLCSCEPMRVSPPGSSTCVRRSWLDTSPAVTPSEAMRSGSRSTRTSRVAPPMRFTWPTPGTELISRITFRSTNHDSSVSLMFSALTPKAMMAAPAVVARPM